MSARSGMSSVVNAPPPLRSSTFTASSSGTRTAAAAAARRSDMISAARSKSETTSPSVYDFDYDRRRPFGPPETERRGTSRSRRRRRRKRPEKRLVDRSIRRTRGSVSSTGSRASSSTYSSSSSSESKTDRERERELERKREMKSKKSSRIIPAVDEFIELNVGGKVFCTLRSTLLNNEWSKKGGSTTKTSLFSMAERMGMESLIRDHNGRIFIDRDPQLFEIILQFLRTGCAKLPSPSLKDAMMMELDYYGLDIDIVPVQSDRPILIEEELLHMGKPMVMSAATAPVTSRSSLKVYIYGV